MIGNVKKYKQIKTITIGTLFYINQFIFFYNSFFYWKHWQEYIVFMTTSMS